MSQAQQRTPIVPDGAPPKPDNPVLKHYGWAPMWVEDSNAVWVVVGDPGDGKSLASMRIAETIDPSFTIDAVASNIVEFMELVMDDSYGQGSVIVLEEGGVAASSYDWYSESNQIFETILETWRHQNRMGIINLPNFNKLHKGARRRTDVIIEMMEAKPWKGYSEAKPKRVEYNNIDDHFTTPFPRLEGKKHKRIRFKLPSEQLLSDYEGLKDEYTDELNRRLYEQLLAAEQSQEEEELTPHDIADDILDNDSIEEYIKDNHGQEYVDRNRIELNYGIGRRISKKVKTLLMDEIDREVM